MPSYCVCRPTYSHHASIVRIQMYVPNLMDPFCSPKSLCQYSYLNEKAAGRSADCVDWADKEDDWDIGDSKPTWPPGQQQPGSLIQMLSGADACRSGFTAALWLQWCYKCFTECAVSFAAESESRGKAMQCLAEKASAPWVLPTRAWNFSRSSAKCKLCQILQSTCSRKIGPEVCEKFLDQRAIWPVENQSTTTASFSSLSQLYWLFSLNSSETVEVAEVAQWLCVKVSLPVANFLKPEKRLQALADLALTSATLCSFSSELVRFETTHLGWKVVQE